MATEVIALSEQRDSLITQLAALEAESEKQKESLDAEIAERTERVQKMQSQVADTEQLIGQMGRRVLDQQGSLQQISCRSDRASNELKRILSLGLSENELPELATRLASAALFTGMRRSEVSGLKWGSVDVKRKQLRISGALKRVRGKGLIVGTTKTHRSQRSIALSDRSVAVLKRTGATKAANELRASEVYEDEGFVFSDAVGRPVDPDRATKEFRKISKGLGLPELTLHGLRNTHASLLIETGAHTKVISHRLGHSSTSFTLDVYGHLLPGVEQTAIDALDEALA